MKSIGQALLLVVVAFALSMILSACGSSPRVEQMAECKLPVSRDAGMGVRLNDCAYWQIGRIREKR